MIAVLTWLGCGWLGGPPPVCNPGSAYDGQTAAFRDASADWGLDSLELAGVRLSAVDFDDDGWPDLAVRRDDERMWLLRNTGTGRFEDVTEASGIRARRRGRGARGGTAWVWADVDNDGDLDVYTGLPDPAGDDTSELLLNQGDGTFELGPRNSAIRDAIRVYGAVFTDVDRDGAIDLFQGSFGQAQDRLLIGQGDGTFADRTRGRGLVTEPWEALDVLNEARAHSNAWAVGACDLDADGAPELLVSSYGRAPNHLWHNDGAGSFDNRSIASGYAFDDEQDWSDNESARCWCTLHPDDAGCAGVPAPAIPCASDGDAFRWNHATDREPFRLGGNSGQTTCADLDQDGRLDLVTSEIVHWDVGSSADPSQILHNVGDLRFERPGNETTGLTRPRPDPIWDDGDITNDAFDFDNDGRTDVWIGATDYPGNRGLLYHNEGDLRFSRVPRRLGIDHARSHGSVAADFDRDGDLDLVVGHSTARCGGVDDCYESPHPRLFENLTVDSNYLQLRLVGGEGSNRAAIGARVEVLTDGEHLQVQEVDGGGGQFGSQTDLALHFGLGEACEAEVTVRWPDADGTTETLSLGGGYRYQITQGEGWSVLEATPPIPEK